jgi:hypothetical protein
MKTNLLGMKELTKAELINTNGGWVIPVIRIVAFGVGAYLAWKADQD